jgi:hypothetical protein
VSAVKRILLAAVVTVVLPHLETESVHRAD